MQKSIYKYLVLAIPCLIYFTVVFRYSVNMPAQDDYDAILVFLMNFKKATGIDKFFLLFSQHNEHRILSSRLLYVLYYYIAGAINFKDIIFIGNAQLIVLYVIIVAFIKKCLPTHWFWPALITSLCLFDLNSWETSGFAMASMQNFGIILFFAASLYSYNKQGNWRYLGAFLQFIAIFSSGNGIVAGALLCLFTIFKRDKPGIILSVLTFIIFSSLYFLHYSVPITGHPATDPVRIIMYFLHIISSIVDYQDHKTIVLAGSAVITSLILLFPFEKKNWIKKDMLPVAFITLFLLGSMATATLFRVSLAVEYLIPSRYLIYPDLLVAMIAILLAYKISNKKIFHPVMILCSLVVCLVFNMSFYVGKRNMIARENQILQPGYYYPDSTHAKDVSLEACKLHIYCIEDERKRLIK